MKLNKIKKINVIVLCLCMMFGTFTINAGENEKSKVLKVIIIEDGNKKILDGEEAEIYIENKKKVEAELENEKNQFKKQKQLNMVKNSDRIIVPDNRLDNKFSINGYGIPSYSWKTFDEWGREESVHRVSLKQRITPYLKNKTSLVQTKSYYWSASSEFSVSGSLGFEAEVMKLLKADSSFGVSWTKSFSAGGSEDINVASNKCVWMTYYPIQKNTWGELNTWRNKDDNGNVNWNIIDSDFVNVFVGKAIYNEELKRYIPDGVYVWEEEDL